MNQNKQTLKILGIGVLIFYLVPFLASKLSADLGMGICIMMLFIFNSVYSFFASFLIAKEYGFRWDMPLFTGVVFEPSVYIFYNSSANIYLGAYIVIGYIGSGIGHLVYKKYNT